MEESEGTDVLEIDGVGVQKAANLREEGFETAEDVATAEIDELTTVDGLGEAKATEVQNTAIDLLDADLSGSDDDDGADEDAIEADGSEEEVERYEVSFSIDQQVGYHVVHIVLEEATSQHQSNSFDMRDDAYTVADELMVEIVESDGETFEPELELTLPELNALYRAVKNGSLDYSSRAGITGMYGTLESVKGDVNEVRKEARRE